MVHVDAAEGERRCHAQGVFVGAIEKHPTCQHVILGENTVYILIHHFVHVDIGMVQFHTVQQFPLS